MGNATLALKTENTFNLRWYRSPVQRLLVNHYAKKIAQTLPNLSVINVGDLISHHQLSPVLAKAAHYLTAHGVHQIERGNKKFLVGTTLVNGYLEAQLTEAAAGKIDHLTTIQYAGRTGFTTKRQFVALADNGPVKLAITALFGADQVTAFNLAPVDDTYSGPSMIVNPDNLFDKRPNEGELSAVTLAVPDRLFPDEKFNDIKNEIPSVIIKDETAPTGILGLATGGLMGAIDFGLKRLYHLVAENARFVLAGLPENVRGNYTIFMGKSDRYLQFFGKLLVGEKTLAETTAEQATNPKKYQYLMMTRPITDDTFTGGEKAIAFVNKKTGVVKYYVVTTLLSKVTDDKVKKSLSVKFAHQVAGREMVAALGNIPADQLTTEETEQLAVFREIADQPDFSTDWVFMEVVRGNFVAQKEWLYRLDGILKRLSEKYRLTESVGDDPARVLREFGKKYSLEDLIYLAMTSSDQGENAEAGFVGKFGKTLDAIDPRYLGELYQAVKKELFQKEKMYAINLGQAAKVHELSDQRIGKSATRGEATYLQMIKNTLTYNRKLAENWELWRRILGIPLERLVIQDSYLGAYRAKLQPFNTLWRSIHAWKRDLVIINSSFNSLYSIKGPVYSILSSLDAEGPCVQEKLVAAVLSRTLIDSSMNKLSDNLMLYHFENGTVQFGSRALTEYGSHYSFAVAENLLTSGVSVWVKSPRADFPALGQHPHRDTIISAVIAGLAAGTVLEMDFNRAGAILKSIEHSEKNDPRRILGI